MSEGYRVLVVSSYATDRHLTFKTGLYRLLIRLTKKMNLFEIVRTSIEPIRNKVFLKLLAYIGVT